MMERLSYVMGRLGLMALLMALAIFSISLLEFPHLISSQWGEVQSGYSCLVIFVEEGGSLIVNIESDGLEIYILKGERDLIMNLSARTFNLTFLDEVLSSGDVEVLVNATGNYKGEVYFREASYVAVVVANRLAELKGFHLDVRERTKLVPTFRARYTAAIFALAGSLMLAPEAYRRISQAMRA